MKAKRIAAGVVVLGGLQAIAILAYRCNEERRDRAPPRAGFAVERLEPGVDATALALDRVGGEEFTVGELRGGTVVLHFWATWCGPCRKELPLLAERAAALQRAGTTLLLVSVDADWAEVLAFFDSRPPAQVVRARSEDYRRLTTGVLPETVVVDEHGLAVTRIRGARDWRTPAARAFLAAIPGETR